MTTRNFMSLLILAIAGINTARGQEVRFYEENGITYRETRTKVRQPVSETRLEDRQSVVYRQQPETEVRKCYRTVRVPITEYRTVTRWVGRYNPFVQPYLVDELVPVVRWEVRNEVIDVPVARTKLVAETRTVKVPVTTRRFVEEEVIRRVAVAGPASTDPFVASPTLAPPQNLAAGRVIAGGAKLENDPPRQATSSAWHPAPVRR